jgi:hypothetical protein
VGDGPPQPGRIQAPGRFQEHRLGVGRDVSGEVVGAVGQHRGMSNGELAGGQGVGGGRQGAAMRGPGGPDRAGGGPGPQPEPGPQPARRRGRLNTLLGPSKPSGIHGGQLLEPVAFQAIHQPP